MGCLFHLRNHLRDLRTSADSLEFQKPNKICFRELADMKPHQPPCGYLTESLHKGVIPEVTWGDGYVLQVRVFCTFPQLAKALCGISLGFLEVRRKQKSFDEFQSTTGNMRYTSCRAASKDIIESDH